MRDSAHILVRVIRHCNNIEHSIDHRSYPISISIPITYIDSIFSDISKQFMITGNPPSTFTLAQFLTVFREMVYTNVKV